MLKFWLLPLLRFFHGTNSEFYGSLTHLSHFVYSICLSLWRSTTRARFLATPGEKTKLHREAQDHYARILLGSESIYDHAVIGYVPESPESRGHERVRPFTQGYNFNTFGHITTAEGDVQRWLLLVERRAFKQRQEAFETRQVASDR